MPVTNVKLMWVPMGFEPTSGAAFDPPAHHGFAVQLHPTLRAAVDAALNNRTAKRASFLMPFIKAHTGEGVCLYDEQGIVGLDLEIP